MLDENITINVIQDNKIVEKKALPLPEVVTNVIKCKNPRCITSIEQELPHRFKLTDKKTVFTAACTVSRNSHADIKNMPL